jgi:hypothetical protein
MRATGTWVLSSLVTLGALLVPGPRAAAQQGPFDLPDDHFLCYKGKTQPGDLVLPAGLQATLADQFEADKLYDIEKPRGICNPVDKNGEGIVDAVTHLTPYDVQAAAGEPAHVPVESVRLLSQFGEITVNTIKEERVLLPANKDADGGPVTVPQSQAHEVDHYKCYRVRVAPGSPPFPKDLQVTLEDQFETPAKLYDVKKPRLLCNPVDKNGEGIKKPDGHLACYRVRPASGEPKHVRRVGVSTADQFVIHKIDTKKEELLCVPSLKNPPAEFCGDGEVNQPPFEECDGDASPCGPGQPCSQSCVCVDTLGQRTFSLDPAESSFLTSFTGQIPLGTPEGTLVLAGGTIDGSGTSPVSLVAPPSYVTVDINIGTPQTTCYEFLSCTGSVHCAGGSNVDALESLDSLAASEPSCVQDGTFDCPNDPSSVCCSNSCEGALVGSGNAATVTTGVGGGDSGAGALLLTCNVRILQGLPIGSDCSTQDYSGSTAQVHALTTGTSASEVTQHCAGNGAPPDVVPTFQVTGANFDCGTWSVANSAGTLVWALPTEEPTTLINGDGATAFVYVD